MAWPTYLSELFSLDGRVAVVTGDRNQHMVELHEEIQPVKSIYHVPAPPLATDLATRTITSVWNLRDR